LSQDSSEGKEDSEEGDDSKEGEDEPEEEEEEEELEDQKEKLEEGQYILDPTTSMSGRNHGAVRCWVEASIPMRSPNIEGLVEELHANATSYHSETGVAFYLTLGRLDCLDKH
jgi:hypothetical protein